MTYGSRVRLASVYLKFINLGEKEEKEREGEGHVAAGTSSMADLVLKLGETERGGWSPHTTPYLKGRLEATST